MSQDQFINRHLGTDEHTLAEMLSVIGVSSVEELMEQVIPHSIRIKKIADLPETGMSEAEFAEHIRQIAAKNKIFRSLIGMGYYRTAVPAVITRNVLENPSWYTSYTPYQAEISQGRMEALLIFQTALAELTGMEVCNCSLLDEATAAAEAMLMTYLLRPHDAQYDKRNKRSTCCLPAACPKGSRSFATISRLTNLRGVNLERSYSIPPPTEPCAIMMISLLPHTAARHL